MKRKNKGRKKKEKKKVKNKSRKRNGHTGAQTRDLRIASLIRYCLSHANKSKIASIEQC